MHKQPASTQDGSAFSVAHGNFGLFSKWFCLHVLLLHGPATSFLIWTPKCSHVAVMTLSWIKTEFLADLALYVLLLWLRNQLHVIAVCACDEQVVL